jgi:hypothetical protein
VPSLYVQCKPQVGMDHQLDIFPCVWVSSSLDVLQCYHNSRHTFLSEQGCGLPIWAGLWIATRQMRIADSACLAQKLSRKKCREIYIIFRSAIHSAGHSAMPFRLLHSPFLCLVID